MPSAHGPQPAEGWSGGPGGVVRGALLLLGLAACTCEPTRVAPVDEQPSASPRDFFPAHAGDRWRMESGESLAVTAVTEDGTAVFFGSDRTSAERYRVTDDAVLLIGPDGRPLASWLERPMEVGHGWRYTLGDAECEARYATVEDSADVAGLTYEHCVEVRRRCRYSAGKPFPAATTELREEVWCPYVGRVAETLRFDPPPAIEGVDAEHRAQVRYYRVQGAPAPPPPESFDCDAFLLLETDVQAACGPRLRLASRDDDGGCTLRFAGLGGELSVRARRLGAAAMASDVDALLTDLLPGTPAIREEAELRVAALAPGEAPEREGSPPGASVGFGLMEGPHAIAVVTSAACPLDRARALGPLLRSLVRP